VQPVIPESAAAAKKWHGKYGIVPVNHMVVIKESTLQAHPWIAQEVFGMLAEAKLAAGLPSGNGPDLLPFGVEPNRKSLETIIRLRGAAGSDSTAPLGRRIVQRRHPCPRQVNGYTNAGALA
jgi:hypothetical protein